MSPCNGGVVVFEVALTVLAGLGIGLSLGAPPGPVNAIIASHTVTRSWRAGFLVGMGATTADTIFLVVSIVAHSAVARCDTRPTSWNRSRRSTRNPTRPV